MHGTTVGRYSPNDTEESFTDKSSGACFYCGEAADGVDARQRVSICEACADVPIILADGRGRTVDERLRRAEQADREVAAVQANQRQADALEELVEQQRIQNAALVQLTQSLERLVVAEMGEHPEQAQSLRTAAGGVADAAIDLTELVDLDAVDRVAEGN